VTKRNAKIVIVKKRNAENVANQKASVLIGTPIICAVKGVYDR